MCWDVVFGFGLFNSLCVWVLFLFSFLFYFVLFDRLCTLICCCCCLFLVFFGFCSSSLSTPYAHSIPVSPSPVCLTRTESVAHVKDHRPMPTFVATFTEEEAEQ